MPSLLKSKSDKKKFRKDYPLTHPHKHTHIEFSHVQTQEGRASKFYICNFLNIYFLTLANNVFNSYALGFLYDRSTIHDL